MFKAVKLLALVLAFAFLASACGIVLDDGNLKIKDNGTDIVSIGEDGFKLDGNITGITLDGEGLKIEYPNGDLVWGSKGLDIKHADGNIRIADGSMVITDKAGKKKTLDTAGNGAEYKTDGGVLVRTGEKAELPQDYPADLAPLMDGFELNASAQLGSIEIVSGYVDGKTVEDAVAFYQPLLIKGSSYSQEKKQDSVVMRAKLNGVDVTIYLYRLLSDDKVNISVVIGK